MLGKLVMLNKKLVEKNGVLRLCEMCPSIRRIFRLHLPGSILDIRETEADAR